jgi:transposase
VADAGWLAELLEHGLPRGSFVPPAVIASCGTSPAIASGRFQAHSAEVQRVQKTLEDAGIKLDSVAADVLGVSGRAMLAALVGGERDPQVLAELARGRLRSKLPSYAKRSGAGSATITPCCCAWRLHTWSTWRAPSPRSTPRSTG